MMIDMKDVVAQDVVTPVPTDADRPDLYKILIVGLLAVSIIGEIGLVALAIIKNLDTTAGVIALASVTAGALSNMLAPRQS